MNKQRPAPGFADLRSVLLAAGPGVAVLAVALLVAPPAAAQSGAMKGPREAQFSPLTVEVKPIANRFVVLRERPAPPPPAGGEDATSGEAEKGKGGGKGLFVALARALEGAPTSLFPSPEDVLAGASPWPYFGGVFDERGCRSPSLATAAGVAAAICGGESARGPRIEYAVVREGVGVRLYRVPVAENEGGLALSEDGRRLAVVVNEDEVKVLHVIDLESDKVVEVRGGWAEPRRPMLAAKAQVLAFEAVIGRHRSVVRVDLAEGAAVHAWSDGGDTALMGLADDGQRLLVRNKRIDYRELFLVDPVRGVIFDVSDRSGEVSSAALHGGASQVVFSSQIGGVCAIYWADFVLRRRSSMLGAIEYCYGALQLDRERRFLLYERSDGRGPATLRLRDRRTRRQQDHMELPAGCDDAGLDPAGRYVAAYCEQDERGRGLFLFAVPQERQK